MVAIYLAGPWACRLGVRIARERLREAGLTVNSRWLDVQELPDAGVTVETQEKAGYDLSAEAVRDLEDIDASEVLIVMNTAKSEGKAVETGIALDQAMPVIVVGKRSNVFHYLPEVTVVETLEEAIAIVKDMYKERFRNAA